MIRTVVWGTGNIGRAAIRAVAAHPELELGAVIVHDPAKVGRDAGELAGLDRELGVAATDDVAAALGEWGETQVSGAAAEAPASSVSPASSTSAKGGAPASGGGVSAVVYAASGDIRPQEALEDCLRAIRAGAVVVTPALYAFYDPPSAPADQREQVLAAVAEGGGSLFVSGIDPGWGNDVLPLLMTGLGTEIEAVRCQEIFDYSTYDQEDSVRYLVGMGQPMDYDPPMTAPTVPTMVWGGQIRLMARALGVELSEIREHVERAELTESVDTKAMGHFEVRTQGGVRFEVQGLVAGVPRIVIEHVTRIHSSVAPQWPQAPDGVGAHRVVIEGRPRIEVTVEAADEGGNRSAGGNATAVGRLVGAIAWLTRQEPGIYDALDVPLAPATGLWGGGTQ